MYSRPVSPNCSLWTRKREERAHDREDIDIAVGLAPRAMNEEEGWKPSADAASAADTTATRHAILCLAEGEVEWPFRRGQWILGLLLFAYMMLAQLCRRSDGHLFCFCGGLCQNRGGEGSTKEVEEETINEERSAPVRPCARHTLRSPYYHKGRHCFWARRRHADSPTHHGTRAER